MSEINKYYPKLKTISETKEISNIDFTNKYIIIYTKSHGIYLRVRNKLWSSKDLNKYDLTKKEVSWPKLSFSIKAENL